MFTENLAAFFNPALLGTAAIFGSATVNGIFEAGFAAAQVGLDAGVEGARYTFTCAQADVPGIAHGSVLTVNGTGYLVRSIQPDGTGVVTLILQEP